MKGILTLKKSAVIAAMYLAMLCVLGYSEPTPEQVKERTQLLCEAIVNNNVEQAKACIKLGADVNAKVYHRWSNYDDYLTTYKPYSDYFVYTPLTYAVEYNKSKDIIELLVKAGADVNAKRYIRDSGLTALMLAVSHGRIDVAELLIKAGADVNAKTKSGGTAILFASEIVHIYKKNVEIYRDMVELLVKSGADVKAKNDYGYTAILSAAGIGVKDVVELLIKAGADVNAKNDGGGTALISASSKDIAELLIKFGADVNAKDNDGKNALMFAKNKEIAEALIKAGADGDAALIWAVKQSYSDYAFAEMLINAGVNPNAKDSEGISALTYAILYGQNDIADLLRAAGAKE